MDAKSVISWAERLGSNDVRLAHHPYDETMLRAADRMEVLFWSENLVYRTAQFDTRNVLAETEK
jgi:beta-galactosidase/beta-glucuronidase